MSNRLSAARQWPWLLSSALPTGVERIDPPPRWARRQCTRCVAEDKRIGCRVVATAKTASLTAHCPISLRSGGKKGERRWSNECAPATSTGLFASPFFPSHPSQPSIQSFSSQPFVCSFVCFLLCYRLVVSDSTSSGDPIVFVRHRMSYWLFLGLWLPCPGSCFDPLRFSFSSISDLLVDFSILSEVLVTSPLMFSL